MAKKFFGWLATVLFAVTCLLMAACTGGKNPGGLPVNGPSSHEPLLLVSS